MLLAFSAMWRRLVGSVRYWHRRYGIGRLRQCSHDAGPRSLMRHIGGARRRPRRSALRRDIFCVVLASGFHFCRYATDAFPRSFSVAQRPQTIPNGVGSKTSNKLVSQGILKKIAELAVNSYFTDCGDEVSNGLVRLLLSLVETVPFVDYGAPRRVVIPEHARDF